MESPALVLRKFGAEFKPDREPSRIPSSRAFDSFEESLVDLR
jgi:hypothetical protein